MQTAGLISEREGQVYDKFRDRVLFPIRDRRGRIIGFGGRIIGDGKPKYLNSPETPIFTKAAPSMDSTKHSGLIAPSQR